MKTSIRIATLVAVAFVLQACGQEATLFPTGDSTPVNIPTVIINCQSSRCRSNGAAATMNTVFTTSACTDALFGASVASTTNVSYDSRTGFYGYVTGWTDTSGSTTQINSGTYNICTCIQYSAGIPWQNCNVIGTKSNASISSTSGQQMINTWSDQ